MSILDSNKIITECLSGRIDRVIDRTLADKRLVGAVIKVAIDGELVYSRAAGFADRELGRLMREDALFRLASVTKPIVSTAGLVLVAQGRLQLDDRVDRWLPEFQPRLQNGEFASLTIRHLMTHTAGLSYRFFQEEKGSYQSAGVSDGMDQSGITLEENLRRLASVPLLYTPGTEWKYSIATDVLGAVIAKVTETPLSEAVHSLVTKPLGMSDTGFIAVDRERLATSYANDTPEPRPLLDPDSIAFVEGTAGFLLAPSRALDTTAYPSGGAGMVGSAGDFLQLLETLRKGGAPLLPESLVHDMTTNQIGDLPMAFWPGRGFGLGITVLKDPVAADTPESPGTWRMGGTYGHSWFVDPKQRLSVVAFTNTALEGMSGQFTVDLCDAIYDRRNK
ncbi:MULTISPECIES: serine hydrolase domain-containing protein [Paenibacillus]|uniref:serine hydrolase domain-containing protein n=1 Tax=Paenibacillus TaxID=44249 RepID=UPI0020BE275D|nr:MULTISPECIES: serine hydrolase domain-containing protein [Paenibacillus]MDH6425901.1 CubicO group peptidase (beta-lactamase class C family) [Paenibacillus sp. PastH-4]MDH6441922.1 CubicO group peptidase (beta-lactamase class C family) [Paenibacillus sp. PastF-4]MDH6527363.1 CubicO group peptidase (beta-lactamase class C family) [Paenibacillus sp. PastH-3]